MKRRFSADQPDKVWFNDVAQHRARDGWVYCYAVIDAFSRRVVGSAIADRRALSKSWILGYRRRIGG
ncbi:hypothetical protein [Demequina lutea]|uniref:Transposase InsO family protein n=1 Tax=Demequina lutea TaxID=431489 RepID=A0A7Y9ZB40_9MICO|nr:hypothetical protein [Demequina lutea]NYI41916.1 transposase InsO family protein [Demequina lutea]